MRIHCTVAILSILVSTGLLLIIYGQNHMLKMLNKAVGKLQTDLKALDVQYTDKELLKVSLEKLLDQGKKVVEELEVALASVVPQMEKNKNENDVCQAEKKTKADELASIEKEQSETKATLKAESDAWAQEINNLKENLFGYNPICDYVKHNPLTEKLCANQTQNLPKDETSETK